MRAFPIGSTWLGTLVALTASLVLPACRDLSLPPPPPKVRADGTVIQTAEEIYAKCDGTSWVAARSDTEANGSNPARFAFDAACRTSQRTDVAILTANKAAADAAAASSLALTAATVCAHATNAYGKPVFPAVAAAVRVDTNGAAACAAPSACQYTLYLKPVDQAAASVELLGKPGCNEAKDEARGRMFACCSTPSAASISIGNQPSAIGTTTPGR